MPDADRPVMCPFCGCADSALVSAVGSTLLTTQRVCRGCGTYFEAIRRPTPDVEERA